MFSTPQKPSARQSNIHSSISKKIPLRGLFQDGIWNCDCSPRLPAAHFQVKKDGPNKGKWFYTCQEPKETGCGFFLWDDDATGREMRAVIGNTRSESEWMKTPADASRDRRTIDGHAAASNNFMAELRRKDEEEFGDWELSPEDERNLVMAVEREDEARDLSRKAGKMDGIATPSLKRKRGDETLPTPKSGLGVPRYGDTNDGDAKSLGIGDYRDRSGLQSPSSTPTPSRFRDDTDMGDANSPRPQSYYDIAPEVLRLLEGQKIDDEVMEGLEDVLKKQALRISGIVKGRDITRLALKAKDVKISELQRRINALETEKEMDKTIIRHFKNDMAHSVEKRRGRGRGKT